MNFKIVNKEDVDPRFPEYTGTITWQWKDYIVTEENLGGITAKRRYTLSHNGNVLGVLHPEQVMTTSLKKWITELIDG